MNQVVLIPQRSNSCSRRGEPTSPANMPRLMSHGLSSPPYEPSQPATASTSMPKATKISLAMPVLPFPLRLRRSMAEAVACANPP